MHPADQFEAFRKLSDEGQGDETIAARFGVTPHVVRQRLKLAKVSPKIVAAFRKGDLSLECVMAFTLTDDHKAQEKAWREWRLLHRPDGCRRRARAGTRLCQSRSPGVFRPAPVR